MRGNGAKRFSHYLAGGMGGVEWSGGRVEWGGVEWMWGGVE